MAAKKKAKRKGTSGAYRKDGTKRRPATKYQTVTNVAAALRKLRGNQTAVADYFGITRSAVSQFIEAHPELKPILRECREGRLDRAENNLDKAMDAGDVSALKFFLETQGKNRGYIRQLQIAGADPTTGALPISITLPSNGREVIPATPAPSPEPIGTSQNGRSNEVPEDVSEREEEGGDGSILPLPGDRPASGASDDIL